MKGEVPEGEEMDESKRAEQLSEMRGRLGTRGCFPLIHILASASTAEKLQDDAKKSSYHGFVVRFQHQAA